ncbi:MAG: monovalent cation/H+ antiporter complex subunit F [Pseudomonadota bacterium]|nr:pH regulation protein F [Pseudomonadota bacterium]MBU1570958.1 pH regulation protein F [Pseudomonadota bacterium]
MITFFLYIAVGLCLLMLFSMYRVLFGPTVLDRLIGVNAIGSKTVILLLLIGFLYERIDMFVDIALAYGFLNFVTVIASARYFHKRKGLYEESFMD